MNNKILFVNTGHLSQDDRTFYHQATSLIQNGYDVEIISSREKFTDEIDQIKINSFNDSQLGRKEKLIKLISQIETSKPTIIIADTPLAVFAAARYKKKYTSKIIYDITEWYPSKKNLLYNNGINKYLKFIILGLANYISGWKSDYFIFGEHFKALPFKILFFWKKNIGLPYYPNLNYIFQYPINKQENNFNITFSGAINADKGIISTVDAVVLSAKKCPNKTFNLRIIGQFYSETDRKFFEEITASIPLNLKISLQSIRPFREYCKIIGNTNLFLDLRKKDFENNMCLPIKLFYYLACGRPVIYSDLKSIKREIPNIDFGFLCNPNDIETISNHIIDYTNNHRLYNAHCNNALKISRSKFNWSLIENDFISFIKNISEILI